MSIVASELKWYKSQTVTNNNANGGKLSHLPIVTGVRNNVFPDVSEAERTSGITRYRKLFMKVDNASNYVLVNNRVHLKTITPADDFVSIFAGTQTDTQNDIVTPTEKGVGNLYTSVSAGENEIQVLVENASMNIFTTGDTIWVSNGNTEEYHANVTVSKTDGVYTIILDTGDQFSESYANSNTRVASCLEYAEVKTVLSDFNVSSSAGTYNSNGIEIDNIGGIEETWTINFTSSVNFSCSGTEIGSVGTGHIGSDFSPNNPNFTRPYFTLASASFSGTWVDGDTIVFRTTPAAVPIWFKQVVPPAAASYSGNNFTFRISGESS